MSTAERPKPARVCLVVCAGAILALGGCSVLDGAALAPRVNGSEIFLGEDEAVVWRKDLSRYTCGSGGYLYCESLGARYLCECAGLRRR